MEEVSFGTDGWRGIIAEDYTYDNLGRVSRALADYLKSPERKELKVYNEWGTAYKPGEKGVVIGYDGRFASENFALYVASVLIENDIPASVTEKMVPTPALAFSVRENDAAAGVMITEVTIPPSTMVLR